ncbi:hypothetical protein LTR16_004140 [Cryomyces antarcticus]|uniref:Gram-positive cocci surface proteins LPxTG domain-containing protein n=1 Tax=Cryomyces antarcticus TaxID=329879 RepID=A0ABR0M878_9PEZI|nr:hypothetical protein LTR16_004140 [Cryomyces antarcticus]
MPLTTTIAAATSTPGPTLVPSTTALRSLETGTSSPSSGGLTPREKSGIVVGVALACAVLFALAVVFYKRRQKRQEGGFDGPQVTEYRGERVEKD